MHRPGHQLRRRPGRRRACCAGNRRRHRARHPRRAADRRHRGGARRSAAHGSDFACSGRPTRSSSTTSARETRIDCAVIDADGDDRYAMSLSADGITFTPLWTAAAPTIRPAAARGARSPRRPGATCGCRPPAATVSTRSPSCRSRPNARRAGRPCWRHCTARRSNGRRRRKRGRSPRSRRPTCSPTAAKLPDFVKLLIAAPLGVALALAFQLADIWPPPRSLLGPLLAAPAIVAAAFALRAAVSRLSRK